MKKRFLSILCAAAVAATLCAGLPMGASAAENENLFSATTSASGLTPFAWYQFDDANNIGKDSMGHFDLVAKTNEKGSITQKQDGTDNYVELRRNYDFAEDKSASGGILYAAGLDRSGLDFSDIIKDSFSVSVTFKSPAANSNLGSHYVLSVGRYSDAISIVPWQNGVQVQVITKHFALGNDEAAQEDIDAEKVLVKCEAETEWCTVTVVGDSDADKVHIYVNGELKHSANVTPVKLSNQGIPANGGDYTFALGGQGSIGGTGQEMHADADIKDCKVFDYALSSANVAALYEGTTTTYAGSTVNSVAALNVSSVDFELTDKNTVSDLISAMPSTVNVTLSDSTTEKATIFWSTLDSGNKLYGFLQSASANVKGYYFAYDFSYVVKLSFDPAAVTITDFKVAGTSYQPTESVKVDSARKSVSFKIEANEGYEIKSIIYDGLDEYDLDSWTADEGYMYINTRLGAVIEISASGGDDPTDPDPTDPNDPTTDPTEKRGCSGSVTAVLPAGAALLSLAGVVLFKKKK